MRNVLRSVGRRPSKLGVSVFVVSLLAGLAIGVPVALAVGWVSTQPVEVNLDIGAGTYSNGAVYSQKMRVFQNQDQVNAGDPPLLMSYSYPAGGYYAQTWFYWNDVNPFNWLVNGGNKWAECENEWTPSKAAGRVITCQFYSTV